MASLTCGASDLSKPRRFLAFKRHSRIREKLAAADPSNTGWQRDVAVSYFALAVAGDRPRDNYGKALAILKQLKAEGRLAPSDEKYIAMLEGKIAQLPP